MAEYEDDFDYAKKKLIQARIEEGEACPVYQSLFLDSRQNDICLLQLNSDIIAQLQPGNKLIIKGESDEPAVICTKSSTFELREAETSNSLLLLPNLLFPEECVSEKDKIERKNVSGIFHTYLEMRLIKPSFKKLRALLERRAYRGKEYEDDSDDQDKFTFDNLLDVIQCSETELKAELIELQTCNIKGYVRMFDFDYKFSIFSQILDVIESQSIPLNKVPKTSTLQVLEELEPKEILEACFSWFFQETDEVNEESGEKFYSIKETQVCLLYAQVLLLSSGKFHLDDFMESWQRSVPEGLKCDLDQLKGIALTDLCSRPPVISYFPQYNLPESVSERFEYLFRVKEKWSYGEIVPFIEDRASATTNVKTLLIKYTRESTKNGVKYYSSKW